MAGTEWPFTRLGMTFFEGQLPALIKNSGRIAVALERIATHLEEKKPKGVTPEVSGTPTSDTGRLVDTSEGNRG